MAHVLMKALLFSHGAGQACTKPVPCLLQTLPLLGHLHPPFLAIMDEIQVRRAIAYTAGCTIGRQGTAVIPPCFWLQEGLRYLFQTESPYVLYVSGTGGFADQLAAFAAATLRDQLPGSEAQGCAMLLQGMRAWRQPLPTCWSPERPSL